MPIKTPALDRPKNALLEMPFVWRAVAFLWPWLALLCLLLPLRVAYVIRQTHKARPPVVQASSKKCQLAVFLGSGRLVAPLTS
jgi:hypothetical protein